MRARAMLLCLAALGTAYGQAGQWPSELQAPQQVQAAQDSSRIDFVSGQSLYMNTYKNHDSLELLQSGAAFSVKQSFIYDLGYDAVHNSLNQYIDGSGRLLSKGPWHGIAYGLDWTPLLINNSAGGNQVVYGSLDIGPVIRFKTLQLPVMLRAGAAAKAWNDSLTTTDLSLIQINQFQRDKGFYGAIDIGDNARIFPSIPLYLSAKGYDRSMGTSHLMAGIGSLLLCQGLPTGDSVFALYADSLINGSDATVSEASEGKTRYIDIPQRLERSYQVTGGIKGARRLFLEPDVTYSYSRYSNSSSVNQFSDRQATASQINFMVNTTPDFLINYNGGLSIGWVNEDKLFGKTLPRSVQDAPTGIDSIDQGRMDSLREVELDSQRVKLNDYNDYRAAMTNRVSIKSADGRGVAYTFDISRLSRTYTYFFLSGNDTMRNYNDNDLIIQRHHLEITPVSSPRWKAMLTGEYSTNLRSYLQSEESANNLTNTLYRIGLLGSYNVQNKINVVENLSAEASGTQYAFPAQRISLQIDAAPPPYSRRFASLFNIMIALNHSVSLSAKWGESYWDQGSWYSEAYLNANDSGSVALSPYYAIQQKSWDHSVSLSAALSIGDHLHGEAGGSFEDIYGTKFQAYGYVTDTLLTHYVMEPYITLVSDLNSKFNVKLKVKRHIDTSVLVADYWDFTFLLTAVF